MTLTSTLILHFLVAGIIYALVCSYAASISLFVSLVGVSVSYFISELWVRFLKSKDLVDDVTYVKCISQISLRVVFILMFPVFQIGNHYLEQAASHSGHHMTVGNLSKTILFAHMILITLDLSVSVVRDVMYIRKRGGF